MMADVLDKNRNLCKNAGKNGDLFDNLNINKNNHVLFSLSELYNSIHNFATNEVLKKCLQDLTPKIMSFQEIIRLLVLAPKS